MNLIVGLGNPGEKYNLTRHNIGFILLDNYVSLNKLTWEENKKFNSQIVVDNENIFLKPQTGMNISGASVTKCLNYYRIDVSNLLVVHDDVDLEFGQIKKQFDAGAAGHHGVEDIVEKLGTKGFWRLRIGAGRPNDHRFDVYNWVLSKFTEDELTILNNINLQNYMQ